MSDVAHSAPIPHRPRPHGVVSAAPGPLEPILLAGSVNLVAGSSGAGKTALLALMARKLLAGEALFGATPQPAPYLAYIGVDKSWARSSSKWFALEGVELRHYSFPDDRHFKKRRFRTKTDRIAILQEALLKVSPDGRGFPPHSVVFIEPIALFLGGNLMDYDACAVASLEVRELAQDMNAVCLVGTVHGGKIKADKKQGYARLQDHILGSAALYGYTDTQLYLASPEEVRTTNALLQVTPHHSKALTLALSRDPEGRFVFESSPESIDTPAAWLHEVLARAPGATLEFTAILQEAIVRGVSRRSLFRLVEQEVRAGRIVKVEHGVYKLLRPA